MTSQSIEQLKREQTRILVAEDNRVNQKLITTYLSKMGFFADVVANGRLAVEALAQTDYALVLMDIQMPEMSGFEATCVIRDPASQVRNHQIPVIAMTAHAMKEDRARCIAAGMDDYISKPINPQHLLEVIEKWGRSAADAL